MYYYFSNTYLNSFFRNCLVYYSWGENRDLSGILKFIKFTQPTLKVRTKELKLKLRLNAINVASRGKPNPPPRISDLTQADPMRRRSCCLLPCNRHITNCRQLVPPPSMLPHATTGNQ
jgi:hypothetical protein